MKNTAHLRRIILSRQASISVVGQGYVGLNVACAAAEEGFFTTGFDINPTLISQLQAGVLSVPGVADKTFRTEIGSRRLQFTSEPSSLSKADIVLIAVPTPVRDHTPDLSFVEGACKQVAAHLSPGRLVILESTTYPGRAMNSFDRCSRPTDFNQEETSFLRIRPNASIRATTNMASAIRHGSSGARRRRQVGSRVSSTSNSSKRWWLSRRAVPPRWPSSSRTRSVM